MIFCVRAARGREEYSSICERQVRSRPPPRTGPDCPRLTPMPYAAISEGQNQRDFGGFGWGGQNRHNQPNRRFRSSKITEITSLSARLKSRKPITTYFD
eukprot:1905701-Prymnesium_polylepis.1